MKRMQTSKLGKSTNIRKAENVISRREIENKLKTPNLIKINRFNLKRIAKKNRKMMILMKEEKEKNHILAKPSSCRFSICIN